MRHADAAYIYVKGGTGRGEAKRTVSMNENIILDFDADDKLVGTEILSASRVVPKGAVGSLQTCT